MDKSVPGKPDCEEATRESLIAISYTLPDDTFASELSSKVPNSEKPVEAKDDDGVDKYRSELMSISNSESPVTLEELKG